MQDVADAAGVSKGLIHYHFHDKETLLTRLIEWMTHESVDREAATLARSTPKTAVDDLWTWVAGEIDRGHLRVLNELAQERGPLISDAIRRSAQARREAAMVTVDRLFALLELRPRVPVQLLADVIVAFIDGLAIHASIAPQANHRVAFDETTLVADASSLETFLGQLLRRQARLLELVVDGVDVLLLARDLARGHVIVQRRCPP